MDPLVLLSIPWIIPRFIAALGHGIKKYKKIQNSNSIQKEETKKKPNPKKKKQRERKKEREIIQQTIDFQARKKKKKKKRKTQKNKTYFGSGWKHLPWSRPRGRVAACTKQKRTFTHLIKLKLDSSVPQPIDHVKAGAKSRNLARNWAIWVNIWSGDADGV